MISEYANSWAPLKLHLLCSISFHLCLYSAQDYCYNPDTPTDPPTEQPTDSPTDQSGIDPPTVSPTEQPTKSPTNSPTRTPTNSPTEQTTNSPTKQPSKSSANTPTRIPTEQPTVSPQIVLQKCQLTPGIIMCWDVCGRVSRLLSGNSSGSVC